VTLDQLRVFVAVAERQHVTHAAEALNLAQSAASHAIATLEERHRIKLLNRIGRRAAGVALWGLHVGMTQALLAALVADEAPIDLRATSFGVFNFVSGIALLLASLIAGALWETIGPYATFMAGAAFTAIGLV
jgi:MFS family permease